MTSRYVDSGNLADFSLHKQMKIPSWRKVSRKISYSTFNCEGVKPLQ